MAEFLARDGRRLAYDDSGGEGPPVLCLAGLSRNARDFTDLAAHLAPHFRVLRLDARGRGRSEHAEDPITEYAIPVEAGDALALLDHLGLARVAIVGTSRGGIVGMALGAGAAERVTALVLNDVGAVVEGRGLLRILATLGREPTDASFTDAARRLAEENRAGFPDVPMAQWEHHAHCLYDEVDGRPVLAYDHHLRSAVARAIDSGEPSVSLWPFFDGLKEMPVLVIRGENSDILTGKTVEAMRRHHPTLEVLELPGRGHAPFLNEPPALAAIEGFLLAHAAGVGDAADARANSTGSAG